MRVRPRVPLMEFSYQIGNIGETSVTAYLVRNGFEVFTPVCGSSSVDMLAMRNGKIFRISVKTCKNSREGNGGSYCAELRRIRGAQTREKSKYRIHKFSREDCDILAVYLIGCDAICFFTSISLHDRTTISLIPKAKCSNSNQNAIEDHTCIFKCITDLDSEADKHAAAISKIE